MFDKGTLDSVTCLKDKEHTAERMMAECYRVLKPASWSLWVSCGDPLFRLGYLWHKTAPWAAVYVYCLLERLPENKHAMEIMGKL